MQIQFRHNLELKSDLCRNVRKQDLFFRPKTTVVPTHQFNRSLIEMKGVMMTRATVL